MAPATTATNQKARPFFDYVQPAGGTIHDAISITNLGDFPLIFDLYTADGYNLPNGDFALRGKSDPRRDAGAWIALSVKVVSVPPHERAIVPFAVAVPQEVTPGDHAGGIVALLRPVAPPPGAQVVTRQGVGARMYLRVPGPLHPSLAVTGLTVHTRTKPFGGGHATIRAVIANTGNTTVNATARLRVTGPFGTTAKVFPILRFSSLLPGSKVQVGRAWPSLPFAGPYRVSLSVSYGSATASATTTLWVIPWALLVIIASALAICVWYIWRRRHRKGLTPKPPRSPENPVIPARKVGAASP